MDPLKVAKYFVALVGQLTSHLQAKPSCIWNMDETGLSLEHKPQKVIAARETKHLQSCTSGNREMITIIGTVSVAGQFATTCYCQGQDDLSIIKFPA